MSAAVATAADPPPLLATTGPMETTARYHWVLRLATGYDGEPFHPDDWAAVYDTAHRERCAPLAWLRSGLFIRRHASVGIIDRWRLESAATGIVGDELLHVLAESQRALSLAGIRSVALKGPALAYRLYGMPIARPMDDVDLYVELPARARARGVFETLGWSCVESTPPSWERYERAGSLRELRLDVLSEFPKHLPYVTAPAPTASPVTIEHMVIDAHDGPLLPAYLAGHLAKHTAPPLLWFLDFATLWERLDDPHRAAAIAGARSVGMQRYLDWAIRRADAVPAAVLGDRDALALLGVDQDGRSDMQRWLREILLAGSTVHRLKAVAYWLWPYAGQRTWNELVVGSFRRITRLHWYFRRKRPSVPNAGTIGGDMAPSPGAPQPPRAVTAPNTPRILTLDRNDLVATVREAIDAGAVVWLRVPGGSMAPSIPRDAAVRLCPLVRQVRTGDVVFALRADGTPILHRIIARETGTIMTRGDAASGADELLPHNAVLARADLLLVGGRERAIPSARMARFRARLVRLAKRLRLSRGT